MTKLNTDWPMDRVLTDEMRSKIQSAFRRNLSTSGPRAETELTDGLPLDVDVLLLRRFEETLLHAAVGSTIYHRHVSRYRCVAGEVLITKSPGGTSTGAVSALAAR